MQTEDMINSTFAAVAAQMSAVLAEKDARIKELEAEVYRLSHAGQYPFFKARDNETGSEWHKIDDDHFWRYHVSYGVLCAQYRQRVRKLEQFNTFEFPVEIVQRLGELHRITREKLLFWADMLHNPD